MIHQLERRGREGQAIGYVQSRVAFGGFPPVLHELDNLARAFDRLEQQNRALLEMQNYTSAALMKMLTFMQRLAGIADFVDDLRMTQTAPEDFCGQLMRFQAGAHALATGKPRQAEEEFNNLAVAQPRSPAVRIGLGTAQAAAVGADDPRATKLLAATAGWASVQDSKARPLSLTQPDLRELVIRHDAEDVTDAWLEFHLNGLNSLQTLSLWNCAKVTDAGLAALAALPNLRRLHFRECSLLTDRAAAHLRKLNLQELSLWGARLTPSGVVALRTIPTLTKLVLR